MEVSAMGLLDRLKQTLDFQTVPVPLFAIREYLQRQLPKITGLNVSSENGCLIISGNVFLLIPFSIKLKPLRAVDRRVVFEVVSFGPLNLEFLKKRLFRNSALCHYANNQLTIDFDNIPLLKKIPLLKIKEVTLGDKTIKFKLGVS
jgi:hypothetical protein